MKTIILFTDFSENAHVAADMALDIAVLLGYSLTLVNSYRTAIAGLSAESVGCPPPLYDLVQAGSRKGLAAEARRLRRKLSSLPASTSKTRIHTRSSVERFGDTLRLPAKVAEIELVVIGTHQKGLSELLSDISVDELMLNVQAPLLVVPKSRIFPIEKILFATDLAEEDLKAIAKLSECGKQIGFHLHLCHVSRPMLVPDFRHEERLLHFMELQIKSSIPFTEIEEAGFSKAVKKFCKANGVEAIALVYRNHTMWWKLFHADHLAKLLRNSKLPILILPQNFGIRRSHGPVLFPNSEKPRNQLAS